MKKLTIVAVSIVVGLAILISFNRLGRKGEPAASSGVPVAPAMGGSQSAPQDATHEKAALQEELNKNPNHAPILLRLAEIEQQEGHTDQAIAHLRQVLQDDPLNGDARLELGRALFDADDIVGAQKETEQLVRDHPTNVDGLYNLGAIHANLGRIDQAREYWKRAVAAGPATDSGQKARQGLEKLNQPGHDAAPRTQTQGKSSDIDPGTTDALLRALGRR